MPTYQYACTACEHRFETVQSFSDASLTECPECAGRLRKLYGSVGVVFKGSGFYRTDSRSESAESSESSKSASTNEKSSESTSEKSAGAEPKKADSGSKESNSSSSTTTTTKPAAAAP